VGRVIRVGSVRTTWGLLIAAGIAALFAAGSAAAPSYRVACGAKSFLIVFSPAGGVVVRVGQDNLLRTSSSNVQWYPPCRKVGDFITNWGGGPSRRASVAVSVFCRAPTVAEFKVVNLGQEGEGAAFVATLGHTKKMFVTAALRRTPGGAGSELRWDTRYCRRS
jgi:hypothetical protein